MVYENTVYGLLCLARDFTHLLKRERFIHVCTPSYLSSSNTQEKLRYGLELVLLETDRPSLTHVLSPGRLLLLCVSPNSLACFSMWFGKWTCSLSQLSTRF